MNAKELAAVVAERNGLSKKQAADLLDSVGDIVGGQLASGGDVVLPGLGKLSAHRVAERQARNPKTGAPVTVPAKTKARFKASKRLNDMLN